MSFALEAGATGDLDEGAVVQMRSGAVAQMRGGAVGLLQSGAQATLCKSPSYVLGRPKVFLSNYGLCSVYSRRR